jgi:hypothetical protein
MTIVCRNRLFAAGITAALALPMPFDLSAPTSAQILATATTPPSVVKPLGQPCNQMSDLLPTNTAAPSATPVLTPIDESTKSKILNSGLPCQETVSTKGPHKTALENLQRGFDFYSWVTFIALNSPADGRPIDRSAPNTPTRWEDMENFRQLLDVMLPLNTEPQWPTDRKQLEAEKLKLMPPACRVQYTPGMMIIKMIEETFNQPFQTGALVDQRGHYALFDILMNRAMFDYIHDHDLYSKAGQMSQAKSGLVVDFPAGVNPAEGQTAGGDPGAIMIKVSWKILDPSEDRRKFHTVDALVSLPKSSGQQPPCIHKTLGLVGFHVVHKTLSRPQWIWTSFEQVDNVPENKDVEEHNLKPAYNFFNPTCRDNCPAVNATPPRPWDPDPKLQLKFHGNFKSQIIRETPLTDATKKMNGQFQNLLKGTVWENYMLISTQWPSGFSCTQLRSDNAPAPHTDFEKQPDMTCAPAPTFLANSTLETYSQGEVPVASSSCIACHGNATSYQARPSNPTPDSVYFNQSDFTFMLEKAQ